MERPPPFAPLASNRWVNLGAASLLVVFIESDSLYLGLRDAQLLDPDLGCNAEYHSYDDAPSS
jgi:hypothetical protein